MPNIDSLCWHKAIVLMGCALLEVWQFLKLFFLGTIGGICIAGITSIIAIVKHRDYAVFLFFSALIGILGILFVIGEFVFPH